MFTHTAVNMDLSSDLFSVCPLSPSLFIPQCLTRFTSTAVISTAFTELINGAEGWVLLNWDNSFSLSLAHMDNYMEKHGEDGGRSAREGGRIRSLSEKKQKTRRHWHWEAS